MKTLEYNSVYSGRTTVSLVKSEYVNGGIYIGFTDAESQEPFCTATVFIERLPENQVTLDTNNNPGIDKFFTENNLGKPTGENLGSGFCKYPIYELNMDEINKYIEEQDGDTQ